MIKVVLADDHRIVLQGLKGLLDLEADMSVVAEAEDGIEAIRLVEETQPDVLVVDLMMPGLDGLAVTRQVRQRVSSTQVVVLSMHAAEGYVLEALRYGALGYVLKESDMADLVRAIRYAASGRRFLSTPLSERAINAYAERAQEAATDPYETLTMREQEVLQLTVEGHTRTEAADRLSISSRTVETHRANLMRKLNCRNQTDLIRYALRRGLIPIDVPR
ncbi:MAG: response regulator transcription factor [Bacteroidetes bacterium]|nr:response regulator transcription factor [Bacteroidota bacterium]